jgi:F-type H+-transporting ATPase subunit delta
LPRGSGSARRYAQAIAELAQESGGWDAWDNDLKLMSQVFGDRYVARWFEDPKRTAQEKENMVRRMFEGRSGPLALNVARMLARQNRTYLLPEIYERYQALARRAHGVVVAQVTTAVPVDGAEQQRIAEHLAQITGALRVELRTQVDPSIIGGLVARVGDRLIDGSVATQLQQLRQRLP